MDIETVIVGIVVLALVGVMYRYWPKGKGLDVNEDGKVDSADAKAAVEVVAAKVVEEVKAVEAKVEEVVVAEVKKVATKAKAKAKAVEAKAEEVVVAAVKKGGRPKKSA